MDTITAIINLVAAIIGLMVILTPLLGKKKNLKCKILHQLSRLASFFKNALAFNTLKDLFKKISFVAHLATSFLKKFLSENFILSQVGEFISFLKNICYATLCCAIYLKKIFFVQLCKTLLSTNYNVVTGRTKKAYLPNI